MDGTRKSPFAHFPDWLILMCFCMLFMTQTILSLRDKSGTFDETAHLPAGYLHLRFGDYSFNPSHPPLVKMLAAVPLLFMEVKMPPEGERFTDFRSAQRFLYEVNDADRLLFLGRLAVLPLALLLGCIIFLWTKQLFGRAAASFALFLYSFEPNILAHAGLVNTDFGAACFIFLAIYAFHRLVHRVSPLHLLGAGLALGLAWLTKFSTLTLLPMLVVLGIGVSVVPHTIALQLCGLAPRQVTARTGKLLLLGAVLVGMGLVAYGTIWAAYRFRYGGSALPGQAYQGPWSQYLPEQPAIKQLILWMWEARALPEAYLYGFLTVIRSLNRDSVFLLGRLSVDGGGWWYYFIVTYMLKTPLPLLFLLLMAPVALRPLWRKDPVAVLCLVVPVMVYFGIASVSRLNIGHRHILPIYPFLFVMAGSLVPWLRRQRVLVGGVVGVIAAWYVVSSVATFPHYLAYFNELAGGPEHGYKYLVDSNLDWGQDLKGLKRYMDAQGIERVWLSYFGSARPEYYEIAYDYLPSYIIWDAQHVRDDVFRFDILPPLRGTVAISATNLHGVYFPSGKTDYFAFYRNQTPIAKIGYSIFIYRFQ